ncbi:hypothetical protein D6856_08175 [Butyrivibrio sp. XB500-5]|nr:hypothetical protein D6856_08175 [Butyrivibrio sp. XB500-5]
MISLKLLISSTGWFATSRTERYKEAFYIDALRFITKPFLYDEVREALTSAVEEKPGEAEIEAYHDRISFNLIPTVILPRYEKFTDLLI